MNDPATLTTLADRLEAAEASEQRVLLIEAFDTANPTSMCWDADEGEAHSKKLFRFVSMCNAEAYESAALMLVPEGKGRGAFHIQRGTHSAGCCAVVWFDAEFNRSERGDARTPALALASAALRARAAMEGQTDEA